MIDLHREMPDAPESAWEWDRQFLWRFRARWLSDDYFDGDTFTALADTGYDGRHEVRVRLQGFMAPERRDPGGAEATRRLWDALNTGVGEWPLRIVSQQRETVVTEVTSFERYVSNVFVVRDDRMLIDVRELLV